MCCFCFWSLKPLNKGITGLLNCWERCCKLKLSRFVLLQFSTSRREQGVNERRTSLHTQVLVCILLQTPPHLHHHQRNLTVDCYLLAFLYLLYLHDRNDQRFHTFCISCQTQGNDVDEDWDGCRDTKIAVALVEQKSDSHVWISS